MLFIVVDTLRADHLGCYGYSRDVSPNLDRLAGKGVVLENLWSASNFTAPAFSSLFTGLYPYQHGVFDFTSNVARSEVYDVVRSNDAAAEAVVTFRFFKNLLRNIWGEVEAVTDTNSFDYSKDLPQAVTSSAIQWLDKRDRNQPFCLFVHYDGPHTPYRLPDEYANRFDSVDLAKVDPEVVQLLFPQEMESLSGTDGSPTGSMYKMLEAINWGKKKLDANTRQWIRDKYDASILYNDKAIGDLLDGLAATGAAEDTVVAVLSDHGEEFLEHGGIGHSGIHLHEEIIRTVGIIHDPALAKQVDRIETPLSHVDVWPTLLNLAQAENRPEAWRYRDFASLLRGDQPSGNLETPIFCQGKSKVAMRQGAKKLIRSLPCPTLGRLARLRIWLKMLLRRELGTEIYDLVTDPAEKENLVGDRALRRTLEKLLQKSLAAAGTGPVTTLTADEEAKKRIEQEMKDLGYM